MSGIHLRDNCELKTACHLAWTYVNRSRGDSKFDDEHLNDIGTSVLDPPKKRFKSIADSLLDEGLIDTVIENDLPAYGKAFANLTQAELLGISVRSEQRLKSLQWIIWGCEMGECNSLRGLEFSPSHSLVYALQ